MSININWDENTKQVILSVYPKHWEWDEEYNAVTLINQLVETVTHEVAVINDLSQTTHLPPNAFMHLRALLVNKHPRIRYTILVGMQPLVQGLWNTFEDLYRSTVRQKTFLVASSVDEARTLITHMSSQAKKG